MAFTWSNSITTGSFASAGALQEIRNNLDYIDNNLACVSHNGIYDSDDDGTIYSGKNSSVFSGAYSGVDSGDNGTVNSSKLV